MQEEIMLEDIRSVLENSLVLRAQLKDLVESAQTHEKSAKQLDAEYKQRLKDLETREKEALEKVHKIFSAEDLERQREQVAEGFVKIENDRLACDRECAEKRGQIANELGDLASKIKDLEAREKALEEDRKTYKAALLRKLGKDPS